MFNERPIVQNLMGLLDYLAGGLSREYFFEGSFGVCRKSVRVRLVTSVTSGYRKISE